MSIKWPYEFNFYPMYYNSNKEGIDGFGLDWFLMELVVVFAALSPKERIGSNGGRNFLLCKKQLAADEGSLPERKGGGSWKAWLNKALNLKVYSH